MSFIKTIENLIFSKKKIQDTTVEQEWVFKDLSLEKSPSCSAHSYHYIVNYTAVLKGVISKNTDQVTCHYMSIAHSIEWKHKEYGITEIENGVYSNQYWSSFREAVGKLEDVIAQGECCLTPEVVTAKEHNIGDVVSAYLKDDSHYPLMYLDSLTLNNLEVSYKSGEDRFIFNVSEHFPKHVYQEACISCGTCLGKSEEDIISVFLRDYERQRENLRRTNMAKEICGIN